MSKKDKFAGVTQQKCCEDCTKDRCVITEAPRCGHPFKAAIADIAPSVVRNVQEVRRIIARQKLDKAG